MDAGWITFIVVGIFFSAYGIYLKRKSDNK